MHLTINTDLFLKLQIRLLWSDLDQGFLKKKTQCLDPINSEYTNLDPKSSTVILVGRIRIHIWTSLLPDPDPMILKGQILVFFTNIRYGSGQS